MRVAPPLATAVAVASLSLALAAKAHAQSPPAEDGAGQTLDAVVVTGSNIKRTDVEGPNPVQVIDRAQLDRSGKVTVADVLRSISANTGNAYNETYNNGWAAGSAGIGLRGLSQKNTLVLLNGRRLASYGFPQGGLSDTFVNLNALPLVAVERIEVLKDGASAVYGSDAVAGVVNIITRQDFEGLEVGASTGTSTEGGLDQQRAKAVGGVGDLERDGYNVLYSVEAFKRDRLDQDERGLTRSGLYTGRPGGGWNGWSAKGARLLTEDGASVPLLGPDGRCPAGTVLTPSAPIDGRAGDTCAYNLAPYTTLIPGTERYQAYVNARFRIGDGVEAFGDLLYSQIRGDSIFGSSPYFTLEGGRFALNPDTGLAEPVPAVLPASSPYNPYGVDTPIEYTFFDLGRSDKTSRSRFYRALGGVRGTAGRWDWEGSMFTSRSRERETVTAGFANRYALAAALADGSYDLWEPSATPQSVIDSINLTTVRPAVSDLDGADFKVSGSLFDLPAGSVGFAAGAEWRQEKLQSRNPWAIDAGLQIRPAIAAVDGRREVSALYAEFNVPLATGLELQLAGRGDHYSDFGDAFSPKASLRWQPFDALLVRAAASHGFRAPSLSENSDSTNISYGAVVDPYDPDLPGSVQRPTFFTVGNPDLDPERTRTYNLGVVLSPWEGGSLSVDYYDIQLDHLIGTNNTTAIVARNDPSEVVRDEEGRLVAIYNRYRNLTELKTSGVDVELRQRFRTAAAGDFTVSSVYTHVRDYRRQATADGPLVDYAGSNLGPSLPRNKATTSLTWDYGDATTALTWYYTGGYDQRTVTAPTVPGRVDAGNLFDLYFGYRGFEDWTLYAKVENVLDDEPPYDPAGFSGLRVPYDITQYDLRGRYVTVGFDYRF